MPETESNLRAEILEELQNEFETKIRELRRQKQLAEQELEDSSDKWRAERRRLNGEIERLETALIQAREELRRRSENPPAPPAPDTAEVDRIQSAADEKIAHFQEQWSTERAQLKSEVVRLQNAVVEALERSSNPMRSQQNLKNQYEAQLQQLRSEKNQLEQVYLRSKAEWETEREKLQKEISQAPQSGRLSAQAKEDLKKQIAARLRSDKVQPAVPAPEPPAAAPIPSEWENEKQKLQADIQRLDAAVDQARVDGKKTGFEEARKLFEPKFEEAARNQTQYEERIHTLEQQLAVDTAALRDRVQELELELRRSSGKGANERLEQLERRVQELQSENARLQKELESSEDQWSEERSGLHTELQTLGLRLEKASVAARPQGTPENKLQTLESELHTALADLATAQNAIRSSSQDWQQEKQSLESRIQDLQSALDRGVADTSTLRQLQEQAEAHMTRANQIQTEFASAQEAWAVEREQLSVACDRVERDLTTASSAWKTERSEFENRILALQSNLDTIESEKHALHSNADARFLELQDERSRIEKEYREASDSWSSERTQLLEDIQQLRAALDASSGSADAEKIYLQERIRTLEETLAKTRAESDDALASALRDIDAIEQRRMVAEREHQSAAADWNSERTRLHTQHSTLTDEVDQLRHHVVNIQGELDERVPRNLLTASQAEIEALQKRQREAEAQHTTELQERDARISDLASQVNSLEESLENTRRVLHADTDQLKQSYDQKLQELTDQRSQLERDLAHAAMIERQFADARELWKGEEQRFTQHCAELQQKLQEALQDVESQSHRHQAEGHQWNDERHSLREQISQLDQALADAQKLQAQTHAQFEESSARWSDERRRVEEQVAQLQTRIEDTQRTADALLEDATRQANAQCEDIRATESAARMQLEQDFTHRLKEAEARLASSEETIQARDAALDALQSEVRELQQRVDELTRQLRETQETARHEQESLKAAHASETQRLADEHARLKREAETTLEGLLVEAEQQWQKDRQELEAQAKALEAALSDAGTQVRPEVLEALRTEYEQKLERAALDRAELAGRIEQMAAAFAEEREQLQAESAKRTAETNASPSVTAGDGGAVEAELQRIEKRISEIAALIDDPATELATVIRKNVEKSEYDAYLKGILFSLGRGPSMQKG